MGPNIIADSALVNLDVPSHPPEACPQGVAAEFEIRLASPVQPPLPQVCSDCMHIRMYEMPLDSTAPHAQRKNSATLKCNCPVQA